MIPLDLELQRTLRRMANNGAHKTEEEAVARRMAEQEATDVAQTRRDDIVRQNAPNNQTRGEHNNHLDMCPKEAFGISMMLGYGCDCVASIACRNKV